MRLSSSSMRERTPRLWTSTVGLLVQRLARQDTSRLLNSLREQAKGGQASLLRQARIDIAKLQAFSSGLLVTSWRHRSVRQRQKRGGITRTLQLTRPSVAALPQ